LFGEGVVGEARSRSRALEVRWQLGVVAAKQSVHASAMLGDVVFV
jgi:hypothetical protein